MKRLVTAALLLTTVLSGQVFAHDAEDLSFQDSAHVAASLTIPRQLEGNRTGQSVKPFVVKEGNSFVLKALYYVSEPPVGSDDPGHSLVNRSYQTPLPTVVAGPDPRSMYVQVGSSMQYCGSSHGFWGWQAMKLASPTCSIRVVNLPTEYRVEFLIYPSL